MSDAVTIVNTIVGAIATIAVAWIGYLQFKSKIQQDQMQAAQKETHKTVVETRDWVDGLKMDVLERHMNMAAELHRVHPTEMSAKIAADARKDYEDHLRQRDRKDAKDVKIAKVEEQVRVDAGEPGDMKAPPAPHVPSENPYEPPKEA